MISLLTEVFMLRESVSNKLTEEEFCEKHGEKKALEIAVAIGDWLEYKGKIEQALSTLSRNKAILDDVMDLSIPGDLFRGLALDMEDDLSSEREGSKIKFKQLKKAESWSASAPVARSYATDKSWHDGKLPPVGIVVRLPKSSARKQDVLLSPSSKTVKWFETMIQYEVSGKTKGDRRSDREFLIMGRSLDAYVHEKFFNE